LAALGHKVVGLELGLAVPADHARDEHHAATRFDAIGIAFGGCPAFGLQDVEHSISLISWGQS
jgi:hypothetical protein